MKRNTKFLLLLPLISFCTINVRAQSQIKTQQSTQSTPYQERLKALLKKFLMDIGFDYQTAQRASTDMNYANSIEPQVRQKMERNSLNSIGLWNQLQKDREDAKKLMNPQEREQDQIEISKREKQDQQKKQNEEYLQSDAYHLKTIIQDKYNKWSAKGEYEKTTDYQSRIANKTEAVRDMINSAIQDYTKFMNSIGSSNGDMFKLSCYIGEYNVDNELLQLTFIDKNGNEFKGQIKLSPEKAQKLKSAAHTANIDGRTFYYSEHLTTVQDKCNLGFYNNNIMSSKIGVKLQVNGANGEKHYEYPDVQITTPVKIDLGEHFFTATNLGIDMQGNENFNFKDVNDACKILATEENNSTQEQTGIERKKIELRSKFNSLIKAGDNSKVFHEDPNKTLQYYKQAVNIYDDKTLAELYDNTAKPDPFGKQDIENRLKETNDKIKMLGEKQKNSNPYENILKRVSGRN